MHCAALLSLSVALLFQPSPSLAGEAANILDRPDLLVYSSSAPRSSGVFSENRGDTGVAFFGNLSVARNVLQATTGGASVELLVGLSILGYAGGFAPTGDVARLYFTLDEPDSFSRAQKKISIQQKAWLTLSATGVVGAVTFESAAVQVEDCSAKASLKDKSGDRSADLASLKVKCKSIDTLLGELGLTGPQAQVVRDVFGTKKISISAKDTDGPDVGDN